MKKRNPNNKKRDHARAAFLVWIAICLIGLSLTSTQVAWNRVRARHTNRHVVKEIGNLGYAGYEMLKTIETWFEERTLGSKNTTKHIDFLEKIHAANSLANPHRANSTQQRKHLIYIQMESVDGISPGAKYMGEPVMPFLYKLRDETIVFENSVDNTASGRTTDGEFLALTSLPPVNLRPVYVNYELTKIPSIPRVLNEAGYYTFSIHGYSGVFWNRKSAHEQLGYQESFFLPDLDQSDRLGWGISDYSILQQAAKKILVSKRPVFAHIVLLTNHHPYDHVGRKFGHEKHNLAEDHIDSLRYMDSAIESFFQTLEDQGILEECLIAIYGDHDSGITSMLREIVTVESPPIYRDTIPLMLYGFDRLNRKVKKVSGLQDLPVIALDEIGVKTPPTFSGNEIESGAPTLSPTNLMRLNVNGTLKSVDSPIDASILTKLAILYPEKLDGEQ